jgi:SAM-dependent methyltransferase
MLQFLTRYFQYQKLLRQFIRPYAKLPKIRSLPNLYQQYSATTLGLRDSHSLDLGCGTQARNPFGANRLSGIDIRALAEQNIVQADLAVDAIPFDSEQFDFVTAYDFLEHIPRVLYQDTSQFPFVNLMSEICRVLKPNGLFFSQTPLYPFITSMSDPTHVNYLTSETFSNYFCVPNCQAAMYGFRGQFSMVFQARADAHLICLMRKAR